MVLPCRIWFGGEATPNPNIAIGMAALGLAC